MTFPNTLLTVVSLFFSFAFWSSNCCHKLKREHVKRFQKKKKQLQVVLTCKGVTRLKVFVFDSRILTISECNKLLFFLHNIDTSAWSNASFLHNDRVLKLKMINSIFMANCDGGGKKSRWPIFHRRRRFPMIAWMEKCCVAWNCIEIWLLKLLKVWIGLILIDIYCRWNF